MPDLDPRQLHAWDAAHKDYVRTRRYALKCILRGPAVVTIRSYLILARDQLAAQLNDFVRLAPEVVPTDHAAQVYVRGQTAYWEHCLSCLDDLINRVGKESFPVRDVKDAYTRARVSLTVPQLNSTETNDGTQKPPGNAPGGL